MDFAITIQFKKMEISIIKNMNNILNISIKNFN